MFLLLISFSFSPLFLPLLTFLEPRKVLPIFKTDEPVCPEGKLSCGNGECVEKELFCNGKPDCKDESDENACSKYRISSSMNQF
jgi:hypothetical protein